GSSASPSGNNLLITLSLSFKPAFQGPKSIYMWVIDNQGVIGTWQNRGAWTIPAPATNPVPTVDSLSPNSGNGATQTFTSTYSDANGYSELNAVYLLFNASLAGASACWVAYVRPLNALYLVDDAATSL